MDDRIKMMQWFADWCDDQAKGIKRANVTVFRSAA
jgi:hypothetical protein